MKISSQLLSEIKFYLGTQIKKNSFLNFIKDSMHILKIKSSQSILQILNYCFRTPQKKMLETILNLF